MFKKKVQFKGKNVIGGKELKALREELAASIIPPEGPADDVVATMATEAAAALLPAGKQCHVEMHKFLGGPGGSTPFTVTVVCDVPLFFTCEGKGGEEGLPPNKRVPTVFLFAALHAYATAAAPSPTEPEGLLATEAIVDSAISRLGCAPLMAHYAATSYVLSGADMMMPGMKWIGTVKDSDGPLPAGTHSVIGIGGNPVPFAVGATAQDLQLGAVPLGAQGKAFRPLHVFGDLLWQHFVKPTAAAIQKKVKAILPKGQKAPDAASLLPPSGFTPDCILPDKALLAAHQLCAGAEATEDAAAPAEAAPAAASGAQAQSGEKDTSSHPMAEDAVAIIEHALCEAVRRLKPSSLPMPVNTFVAQFLVPCRPAGFPSDALNFKATPHKKAVKFLQFAQSEYDSIVSVEEQGHATALDHKATGTSHGTTGVFLLTKINKGCLRMSHHKKGQAAHVESGKTAEEVLLGVADEEAVGVASTGAPGGGSVEARAEALLEPLSSVEILYRAPRRWHDGMMSVLYDLELPASAVPAASAAAQPGLEDVYGGDAGPAQAEAEEDEEEEIEADGSEATEQLAKRREAETVGLPEGILRRNYRDFIKRNSLLRVPSGKGDEGKTKHKDPEASQGKGSRPSVTVTATPFAALWRASEVPDACDLEVLFVRCVSQLLPMHRIEFDASPPVLRKGVPPSIELIAERRGGNKTVVKAVGLPHYFGDGSMEPLAVALKSKMSTSVAVFDPASEMSGPMKGGKKPPPRELVIQGSTAAALLERYLCEELNMPKTLISVKAPNPTKKKK